MKKVVCRPISGQIVYATVKENEQFGTIGADAKDITDDCIAAVIDHMFCKEREMGNHAQPVCYEKTVNGKTCGIAFYMGEAPT